MAVVSRRDQAVTPDVLDRCRRGDRDAFRLVYETYKDSVYSMAVCFFKGDRATAADVTQQVFLMLMKKMNQFRGDAEFSTWLHRLVANACIDRTRSGWRRLTALDPADLDARPSPTSPSADLEREERALRIQQAVAALTPKIRMAILLRYFADLSYGDMARALNCSIGTVASRLSKGHAVLSHTLAPLNEEGRR